MKESKTKCETCSFCGVVYTVGELTELDGKKMCPECYCLLPSDFGKFPSKILAILGVRGSGKTLYIAHLLSEISERLSEMGFVINASNEAIENFTKRYRARADVSYVGTEVRA